MTDGKVEEGLPILHVLGYDVHRERVPFVEFVEQQHSNRFEPFLFLLPPRSYPLSNIYGTPTREIDTIFLKGLISLL